MSRKPLMLLVAAAAVGGLCIWLAVSGASPVKPSSLTESPGPANIVPAADVPAEAPQSAEVAGGAPTSKAEAAMRGAAEADKYLFVYFYNGQDEQTRAQKGRFDSAVRGLGNGCRSIAVDVADPSEKTLVAKLGVDRTPMPVILAFAPNGAITAGLGADFTEEQMMTAFVSPRTEECVSALQRGRLVLLCVQGASTRLNDEAMKGAKDFARDPRFAEYTDIVTLDPGDQAEAGFLKNLQIDPKTPEAVTVLMAPPGTAVAKFAGKIDSNEIAQRLQTAMSGATCGSGASCAPGSSCAPGGSGCAPTK